MCQNFVIIQIVSHTGTVCLHCSQKSIFSTFKYFKRFQGELCFQTDLVSSLEPTVVGDVLPQGVSSIQRLLVDAVIAVLLHHALGLLLEGLHGGVLPPRAQVSVFIVLPPFEYKLLSLFISLTV